MRLRDFSEASLLIWWAREPSANKQDIKRMIGLARLHQIDHEDLTIPKMRRHVRKLLLKHQLIPGNRPATDQDYQQAKETIKASWFDQDII